jgi:hypothetical protein
MKENCIGNRQHDWSVDETGTLDINRLITTEIVRQERVGMMRVSDKVLKVHGVMPGEKQEGIISVLYKNCNGLSNRLCGN